MRRTYNSTGTGRNIRVPVNRDELIQAIERKANQCKKDWEKASAKYEKDLEKWKTSYVKALRDASKALESLADNFVPDEGGNFPDVYDILEKRHYSGNSKVISFPSRPYEPTEPQGYAHILRILRMSDAKTISLTEDQFRAYMDGCALS